MPTILAQALVQEQKLILGRDITVNTGAVKKRGLICQAQLERTSDKVVITVETFAVKERRVGRRKVWNRLKGNRCVQLATNTVFTVSLDGSLRGRSLSSDEITIHPRGDNIRIAR